MRSLVPVLLACACGRLRFEPQRDAAADDVAGDDATGPPLCGIPFGQWTLTAPTPLDDVNNLLISQFPAQGDQDEFDPVFSETGLSLYFTSDQSGAFQVWVATRPSLTAPFDTATLLGPDVNAATNSIFGFQPLDHLSIAIVSAPYAGAIGGDDFWLGTLAGTWTWTATSLSTADNDGDARMTADGLTVYFPTGAGDVRDIYRATRPSLGVDFGPPTLVPELNSALSDSAPLPVTDGIFVVSDRPGTAGGDDIWYANRAANGSYEPLVPLTVLNTSAFDGEPALFEANGACELIFVSTRTGPYNLYRATVTL